MGKPRLHFNLALAEPWLTPAPSEDPFAPDALGA